MERKDRVLAELKDLHGHVAAQAHGAAVDDAFQQAYAGKVLEVRPDPPSSIADNAQQAPLQGTAF